MKKERPKRQARTREEIIEAVLDEAQREIVDPKGYQMGDCHLIWERAKAILKEGHGIDWETPAEENPHILFD